jgi:hypothetical protein
MVSRFLTRSRGRHGWRPDAFPPERSRFAHLGPFTRHLGVDMVGQLLALDEAETAASTALWHRVLMRLRPSRRPAFIARLHGWPDHLRRRVEPVIASGAWIRRNSVPRLALLRIRCYSSQFIEPRRDIPRIGCQKPISEGIECHATAASHHPHLTAADGADRCACDA